MGFRAEMIPTIQLTPDVVRRASRGRRNRLSPATSI
jgi:hypothetical protein